MREAEFGHSVQTSTYPAARAGLRIDCALTVACTLLMGLAACSRNDAATPNAAPAAVPVITAVAQTRPAPLRVRAIGNVEAYSTVAVKSRIDGQIVAVHFRDGDDVTRGQLLFELDARALEAQTKQLRATVERDRALAANASGQEQRYRDLKDKGFISAEGYSQAQTNAQAAEANLNADQAALENAQVQLSYTRILSPLSGRAGRVLLQVGNVVKANDTAPMVVINQLAPAYVSFTASETLLAKIRAARSGGKLAVEARSPDSGKLLGRGEVSFIDNAIDMQTGTIRLRATFANRDRALWPGQFIEAALLFDEQAPALVIPAAAVQNGPQGEYVYVVKPDRTAEMRPVGVERIEGADAVVGNGLAAGETVVVVGQVRLVPGAAVDPKPGS